MVTVIDFYTSGTSGENPPSKTTFDIGNKVYAYSKLEGVSKGGIIKTKWYHKGTYKFFITWEIPEDWEGVWSSHWHNLQNGESGDWTVRLYYNDSHIGNTNFTVNPPPLDSTLKNHSAINDGKVTLNGYLYWHEGLSDWTPLNTSVFVPSYTEIDLLALPINSTDETLKAHTEISVEYPDGTTKSLAVTLNQDCDIAPGTSRMVQIEPFITTSGEHRLYANTYETLPPLNSTVKAYTATNDGKVVWINYLYWYEGLADWIPFTTSVAIPDNTEIHILATWRNDSSYTLKGHVDLSVNYPDGSTETLIVESGQDVEVNPGDGHIVQFKPFVTTSGEHRLYVDTYETPPDKIIVDVKNTEAAGYFTVGVSNSSNIGGSDCNLHCAGGLIEELPIQYIYLNVNEQKTLTFNFNPESYSGRVYAIAKIWKGDSIAQEDCLDGDYNYFEFK